MVEFTARIGRLLPAAWLMWFVGAFRWENQTPEDDAANDRLVPVAGVLLVLAVGVLVAVIVRRWRWAAAGLIVEGAVVAIVFVYALGESTHSDHQLILYTAGVMALGYAAVALSARPT
ncbi:MAG: hypothetical protein ACRDOF_09175 [Gaiellaceae bacterium]